MRAAVLIGLLGLTLTHLGAALAAGGTTETWVVIRAGELLAEPGTAPRRNQTVVVRGSRIVAVHDGLLGAEAADAPEGAAVEVVELAGHFVLPGLMDAHSHLMWSGGDHPPKKADKMTSEDLTLWTLRNARTTLGAGFTTVREQASGPLPVFAVRDWINAGRFLGPRILAAGNPVTAPGGHGDMTRATIDPGDVTASNLCNGPESCRRAVRMQKKLGSDVIKLMATGGFFDATGTEQLFFYEEMRAVVEAAHQLGLPVGTHAYAGNAIADAVRAGVDSVDHGFGADDATLKRMKEKGIYLVPTLSIAQATGAPREYREKYRAFERALALGVPIAFGTDVGGIPHRLAAKEFSYMVRAGMKPADAIAAATVNTARLLRIAEDVGTITPGRLADLIAVRGSPLDDVSRLEQVDFVMKSGRIAKRDGRLADIVLD